jgi:hypothetical protein
LGRNALRLSSKYQYIIPHKAVVEVSTIGSYRRKAVGVENFGVVAVVSSPIIAGCSVV